MLQTLVRGAGLGSALLRHATPMVALALQGLGSPCWAMRNAAIQLFSEYLSLCSAPSVPAIKKGSASSRGLSLQQCPWGNRGQICTLQRNGDMLVPSGSQSCSLALPFRDV